MHDGEPIEATQPKSVERVGRYLTRAPVGLAKVFTERDGSVRMLTPPDPKTGRESRTFDALDWVHAITTQLPDPGQHMVRYSGRWGEPACARCTCNRQPAELGVTCHAALRRWHPGEDSNLRPSD